MNMSENLVQLPEEIIKATHAVEVPDGILVNGEIFRSIPIQKFQDAKDAAEIAQACVCILEGGQGICVCPAGFEQVAEAASPNIVTSPDLNIPLGYAVKDPDVTIALMEKAAESNMAVIEDKNVPSDYLDIYRETFNSQINRVSADLATPGSIKKARHEALRFIKRAELPAAIIASAVVVTFNK